MDIPIQVAVRVFAENDFDTGFVQTFVTTPNDELTISPLSPGIIKVDGHTFPATFVLPENCSQSHVYHQTVSPLISSFLDGYDVSIVTYGQKLTGKSYTMFGPGFDCIFGEGEQGIIQRAIRDIFNQLTNHTDRNYIINIGWVELCGEQINDLLAGMVQVSSIGETFQWLQIGLSNKTIHQQHNLISLTLEQQWISSDGLIQHRLSTFSFCDLGGTERININSNINNENDDNNKTFFQSKDLGIYHLERIVSCLIDTTQIFNSNVDYNQTALTSLLKDSFGGRAQTLMILCISPLKDDSSETIANLHFGYMVQLVRNFVVMNTFSNNNTPANTNNHNNIIQDIDDPVETFGLQFAASQWLKLVSNAEGLFSKLVTSKTLTEQDREQIVEWMFLKAECEECLSSGELNIVNQRLLGPIQETDEPCETTSDQETSCQQNTDIDSDSESQRPDLEEKMENLMDEFRIKTDNLVREKYQEFQKINPKILNSFDSFKMEECKNSQADQEDEEQLKEQQQKPQRGRRKSIQPGSSLSSNEIAMLHQVASRENIEKNTNDFLVSSADEPIHHHPHHSRCEILENKIRKIQSDIDAGKRQIKELEHTIILKQKLITELIKNNDTRTTAKQRFNKKKNKLETEYDKIKKQLSKAIINGTTDKSEIQRLQLLTSHIEQRLQDLASIKHIACESGQKVKKLQKSLQESRKQLELLQKSIKKQKKTIESIENELKQEKIKESKTHSNNNGFISGKKNLREVSARISHLDHVLKEKSQNLEEYIDGGEKESLRHEIRSLRRSRDQLIDDRCYLDKKQKKEKMLSHTEHRKLLECDEGIEAIDAAIEFKNELICGRKSVDTNEKIQREKGEQMLMERLNKLSTEEMRTLIYKYFQKVIDLRDSSRKLEIHLMNLERERDAWEWRERILSNAVRQARMEGERNAVLLQRQHETKLTLMLRHMAEETSTNSSMTDPRYLPTTSSNYHPTETDMELDLYKPGTSKQIRQTKHSDLDLYPLPVDGHLNKYKPLDKYKERENKNKLFAKFQVLTRYHGSDKRNKLQQQQQESTIPQQNLKQLQPSSVPVTKVTREKNKIIIQQDPSR